MVHILFFSPAPSHFTDLSNMTIKHCMFLHELNGATSFPVTSCCWLILCSSHDEPLTGSRIFHDLSSPRALAYVVHFIWNALPHSRQTLTYPLSPGANVISPVKLSPILPELSFAPSGLLLLWFIYLKKIFIKSFYSHQTVILSRAGTKSYSRLCLFYA